MTKLLSLVAFSVLFLVAPVFAAEVDSSSSPGPELKALVDRINDKLRSGTVQSEEDLGDDVKEFDAIIARHKDASRNELAQVALMKAMLFSMVFEDDGRTVAELKALVKEYPGTEAAAQAAEEIAPLERRLAGAKVRESLKVGTPFPPFEVTGLDGNPISLAALKGKVVLIDFWATWCMPCVMELPSVRATYQKYHDKGFDVVGISLDQDRTTLQTFLKRHKVAWPQYFDGMGWQNTLAEKYGVTGIPQTYLLDRNGVIIGRDLRGGDLGAAVAAALGGS